MLIEDDNLFTEEDMTSEFTDRVNIEFESKDFGAHTMNKFATYKFATKHLLDSIAENFRVIKTSHAKVVKVDAI